MWSFFDNSTDEGLFTGHYRALYRRHLLPTGRVIPLVITETGIDGGPIMKAGGWKVFTSLASYVQQLKWYDSLLRADDYVLGCTIFLLDGTPEWDTWSVNGEAVKIITQYMNAPQK